MNHDNVSLKLLRTAWTEAQSQGAGFTDFLDGLAELAHVESIGDEVVTAIDKAATVASESPKPQVQRSELTPDDIHTVETVDGWQASFTSLVDGRTVTTDFYDTEKAAVVAISNDYWDALSLGDAIATAQKAVKQCDGGPSQLIGALVHLGEQGGNAFLKRGLHGLKATELLMLGQC